MALYDPALSAQKALLRPLAASGDVRWFGYLSSTGVYGDWQGEWVDESSPCRQTSARAVVRQEAEAAWLKMHEEHGLPVHVFRLGGIYGPGRSVLDSLSSTAEEGGEGRGPGLSPSKQRRGRQRYTARCHVYDICAALVASMARPQPGRVYNVVDDEPAPRHEVAAFAQALVYGGPGPDGTAASRDHGSGAPGSNTAADGAIAGSAAIDADADAAAAGAAAPGGGAAEAAVAAASTLAAVEVPRGAGATTLTGPGPLRGGPSSDTGTEAAADGQTATVPGAAQAQGATGSDLAGASTSPSAHGGAATAAAASGPGGGGGSGRRGEVLEEKRVRNVRLREELGVVLRYPTYREGVAAIHAGELWPLQPGDLGLL